jgi:hypothetical protein
MARQKRGIYTDKDGDLCLFDGEATREDGSTYPFRRSFPDHDVGREEWARHVQDQADWEILRRHRAGGFPVLTCKQVETEVRGFSFVAEHRQFFPVIFAATKQTFGEGFPVNLFEHTKHQEDLRSAIGKMVTPERVYRYVSVLNIIATALIRRGMLPQNFPKIPFSHHRVSNRAREEEAPTKQDYDLLFSLLKEIAAQSYSNMSWVTAIRCAITIDRFSRSDFERLKVCNYRAPFIVSPPDYKRLTPKRMNASHLTMELERLCEGKSDGALLFSRDQEGLTQLSAHYIHRKYERSKLLIPISRNFNILSLKKNWHPFTTGGEHG